MNVNELLQQFLEETWFGTLKNIIDIMVVGIFFYQIIAMLKGTRAAQVVTGIIIIFITYSISNLFDLVTLNWIINKFSSSFIIVIIVLFQDDIRRLLTKVGRGPFLSWLEENPGLKLIEEVAAAIFSLSRERQGAIIVFERGIGLDKLYNQAVKIDAILSEALLISIFQSFSPLHDGAVIVQKNRIHCASAHLPLTKKNIYGRKLGTRHSAALGISEQSDAVVLVVSEETGVISFCYNGILERCQHEEEIKKKLKIFLIVNKEKNKTLELFFHKILFINNKISIIINSMCRKSYKGIERRIFVNRRKNIILNDLLNIEKKENNNKTTLNKFNLDIRFPNIAPLIKSFNSDKSLIVLTPQEIKKSSLVTSLNMDNVVEEDIKILKNKNIDKNNSKEITLKDLNEMNHVLPKERFIPPEYPIVVSTDLESKENNEIDNTVDDNNEKIGVIHDLG